MVLARAGPAGRIEVAVPTPLGAGALRGALLPCRRPAGQGAGARGGSAARPFVRFAVAVPLGTGRSLVRGLPWWVGGFGRLPVRDGPVLLVLGEPLRSGFLRPCVPTGMGRRLMTRSGTSTELVPRRRELIHHATSWLGSADPGVGGHASDAGTAPRAAGSFRDEPRSSCVPDGARHGVGTSVGTGGRGVRALTG
ncbi:hypothetical protein C1701_10850 [Actinoalloteichus sp. AHMU CJ021]|nr:hypothetical protein C1701_10850 [Actinoalloteichus sp. AHMU CJ021]